MCQEPLESLYPQNNPRRKVPLFHYHYYYCLYYPRFIPEETETQEALKVTQRVSTEPRGSPAAGPTLSH